MSSSLSCFMSSSSLMSGALQAYLVNLTSNISNMFSIGEYASNDVSVMPCCMQVVCQVLCLHCYVVSTSPLEERLLTEWPLCEWLALIKLVSILNLPGVAAFSMHVIRKAIQVPCCFGNPVAGLTYSVPACHTCAEQLHCSPHEGRGTDIKSQLSCTRCEWCQCMICATHVRNCISGHMACNSVRGVAPNTLLVVSLLLLCCHMQAVTTVFASVGWSYIAGHFTV
jgi:hypothetical protein